VETIKYSSKAGRIWKFDGEDWSCEEIEVPQATFYEQGGDAEKLREIKEKGVERKILLSNGDAPNGLCHIGYIYFPIIRDGKKEIVRTKTLTRILNDN